MFLALIICIILASAVTIVLIVEINKQQQNRKLSKDSNYYLAELPNLKIQQELLDIVGGDRYAAKRLIDNIKQKNPGKTELWYWEKAIEDLKTDRR